MLSISWLFNAVHHPQGKRGLLAATACLCCVGLLAYSVSASHSIESLEHLLSPDHYGAHDAAAAHEHDTEQIDKSGVRSYVLSFYFITHIGLGAYHDNSYKPFLKLIVIKYPTLILRFFIFFLANLCISEVSTIDGVLEIRSGHFWQLDFSQLVSFFFHFYNYIHICSDIDFKIGNEVDVFSFYQEIKI
uniref:Heparan-alpha-glucosaminide N-acetyltransferase n=1 Tax=Heterorhabditis bacteriophora TaxID=37862 RepID=A0A1I7WH88_HETBA